MIHDTAIATAADYADAMMTARRSTRVLILLTLLVLLVQISCFFLIRFNIVSIGAGGTSLDVTATLPATSQPLAASVNFGDVLAWLLPITSFLGVIFPILLGFVLLLIVNIMLVGRLIGAGRVTSAYVWSLVLLVLLFPWQAFWGQGDFSGSHPTWKLPGVLYTWYEISHPTLGAHFASEPLPNAILKWARYVGFPALAVIILLAIQIKSNRGMRQALGEESVAPVDLPTTSDQGV